MPVAERRQETETMAWFSYQGFLDNWPDTGPGARLWKQADAGQVSSCER
jgi:hypothetical protein